MGLSIDFHVLGALEVFAGSQRVTLHGPRQERLLAALLLANGRLVGFDSLAAAVWETRAPLTARRQIQDLTGRLRATLVEAGCGADIVGSSRSGCVLRTPVDAVDASRFRAMYEAARRSGDIDPVAKASQLRAALALWRGEVLAGMPGAYFDPARAGLSELRLVATEEMAEAELKCGRHYAVLDELVGLASAHPFRERFVMFAMLAMARSGRTADAVDIFHRLRIRLADELGVGPRREIVAAYEKIIRGQPESVTVPEVAATKDWTVPAQLPADPAAFTGRISQLADLDRAAGIAGSLPTLAVVILTGAPGVGKTALATRWANRVARHFPDGQLYVNLRGWSAGEPTAPVKILGQFLRALGRPADGVPSDLDEAASLYRTLLSQRRLLIVLDNAASAEQVRPLLPGGRSVVLVTSRYSMRGLAAIDGAARIELPVLPVQEARELLDLVLGRHRTEAEERAVSELARVCGYLPLALRIAGSRLAESPRMTVASYVTELRAGDVLGLLHVPGDEHRGVSAVFATTYGALQGAERRLFRLMGAMPVHDFTAGAAAALAQVPAGEVAELIGRLRAASLVQQAGAGRYTFHDLLRLYARQLSSASDAEVTTAWDRLIRWYHHSADDASRLLFPGRLRLPPAPHAAEDEPASHLGSRAGALAWTDAERMNLVAAARHAAGHGPASFAWLLADALRGYFGMGNHTGDAESVAKAAATAADRMQDGPGLVIARLCLAEVRDQQGSQHASIGMLHAALDAATDCGWLDAQATIHTNLGGIYADIPRAPDALRHLELARMLHQQMGVRKPVVLANLGLAQSLLGRLSEAAGSQMAAMAIYEQSSQQDVWARAMLNAADADRELGDYASAKHRTDQARTVYATLGHDRGLLECIDSSALISRDEQRLEEALALAQAGLVKALEIQDERNQIRARTTLGTILVRLRQPEQAAEEFRLAEDGALRIGCGFGESDPVHGLATAYLLLGHISRAETHAHLALARARTAGAVILEGSALTTLTEIRRRQGRHSDATAHAEQAVKVLTTTEHRLAREAADDALRSCGADLASPAG